MPRPWFLLPFLLTAPLQAAEPRFGGDAGLSVGSTQISADRRFSLSAALHRAPRAASKSGHGRFALIADMAAHKAIAGSCGGADALFSDGFEGP